MNRRGFLRLPGAAAAVVPAVAHNLTKTPAISHKLDSCKPATITVKPYESPLCLCGLVLMTLPQEWEDRAQPRRMVCPNPRCANYGIVVMEKLFELEIAPDQPPNLR